MSVINTNVKSLVAQKSLSINSRSMSTAMERLSTGTRINSAKDDAAGLAIGTRMNSDLRGMSVAIRNANDGISMMQTAEGALGEVSNMLQRMRDLSLQAANATMSDDNRAALQAEFSQLVAEIDNVSDSTNFNSIKLLDGSAQGVGIQIGVKEGNSVSFDIEAADSTSLGLRGFQVQGEMTTGRAGAVSGLAVDDVQINGFAAFATAAAADTATALATAINTNSGSHRVVAEAFNTVTGTKPTATSFAAGAITINGDSVGVASSVEELVTNINRDAAGVTAHLADDGSIELSNDTGAAIIIAGTAPTTAGFTAATYQGFVTMSHLDGEAISVKAKNLANGFIGGAGTLADVALMGLNETSDGSVATGKAVTQTAIATSDILKINGTRVGASKDGSATSKVQAINAISSSTGVTASASTTAVVTVNMSGTLATAMTAANAATTFSINGTDVALSNTTTSLSALVTAINLKQIPDVVASSDDDGRLILTSETGSTISVLDGSNTFVTAMSSSSGEASTGLIGATVGTASAGWSVAGRISLSSESGADIRVEASTAAMGNLIGFAEQGGTSTLVGGELSITSAAGAGRAVTQIDTALDAVSLSRANLGAYQNRLTAAVDNLTDQSRHLSESRSRIMDTDYAIETTNLARAQVIQQAATAMLAQANQQPSGVLALLQ
jgi:flagellin